jgi:hypothetical protein
MGTDAVQMISLLIICHGNGNASGITLNFDRLDPFDYHENKPSSIRKRKKREIL